MGEDFNLIAPVYDFLVKLVYRDAIRNAQVVFLDRIAADSKVLILGGGSGWLLEELSKINTDVTVVYVEASKVMLTKAKKYANLPFTDIRFVHGTEKDIEGEQFDFVITPFVLDVFPSIEMLEMVNSIKKLMFPDGLWLCVDFNLFDRSIKARLLSFTMIYFFRVVSGLKTKELLDYFGAIKQVGGETITHQYFYNKFIKAELFRVK